MLSGTRFCKVTRVRYASVGTYAMQAHMTSASDSPVVLHLVTRLRTLGATGYLHSPIGLQGNVHNAARSNFGNCTFHYKQTKGKRKIISRTGNEDPERK